MQSASVARRSGPHDPRQSARSPGPSTTRIQPRPKSTSPRSRSEPNARVDTARVAPTQPRPKVERRKRSGGRAKGGRGKAASEDRTAEPSDADASSSPDEPVADVVAPDAATPAAEDAPEAPPTRKEPARRRSRGGRRGSTTKDGADPAPADEGAAVSSVSVEEQVDVMEEFLEGLLDAFEAEGDIEVVEIDDETSELQIEGEDLGLLIGPKGQTLMALQDLARTVAQRRLPGPHEGRVRVDVSGYRERRRAALERFAAQVAEDVLDSGTRKVLEPMNAADRKVVHDVVNGIDGVSTTSEGDEPRRRVVVQPDD